METKECKECKTQINKDAKKCPNCRSDQRDFLKKHPIVSVLLIICGVGIFSSMIMNSISSPTSNTSVITPISQNNISALEKDLKGWAEGRWEDVQVISSNGVIVRVYALPGANKVALDGYCNVLKESANKYIPSGNKINLFVYQFGEVTRACK